MTNIKKLNSTSCILAYLAVGLVILISANSQQTQHARPHPSQTTAPADGNVIIDMQYFTVPDTRSLTGIGIRIHYQSSKITLDNASDVLRTANILADSSAGYGGPYDDDLNLDGDLDTDKYILFGWAQHEYDPQDLNAVPPGISSGLLAKVNLLTAHNFAGSTTINFRASATAEGYTFANSSLIISEGAAQVKQTINLKMGWNHLSFNVEPSDLTPEGVFGILIGNNKLDKVISENKNYSPDLPNTLNSLITLNIQKGFWVRAKGNTTLSVTGIPINPQSHTISLKSGWNSVPYFLGSKQDIRTVMANLIDTDNVSISNLQRLTYEGLNFDPRADESVNSLLQLKPGAGYWVKVGNDDDFNYSVP